VDQQLLDDGPGPDPNFYFDAFRILAKLITVETNFDRALARFFNINFQLFY
jgi:hypothetical protein